METLHIPMIVITIVITQVNDHRIKGQLTNQINPFVHISPHWMKESAINSTFNEKLLHANECRRCSHWRGYQITSLKPPKDVTRGHSSHPWMPPTARRESPIYIYTMSNKRYSHSFSHILRLKLSPLQLLCFYLTLPLKAQWPAPHQWPLKQSFLFGSYAGPLMSWVPFYLDDQFNSRLWHHQFLSQCP